ncbi:flagellar protein FlaG [Marinimicrobium alkaliphilum]|uniref:flagellar protein FlaG n=1 Tax=Marinimicrobium alkaliphilum TaxID=2202654 RepID=UPI001E3FFCEC|nr:flagellar protein FlaG [Marinimicrobium alkaliphilum]
MSEVTMLHSAGQPQAYKARTGQDASPDVSRQAAQAGGKVLPPTVSAPQPVVKKVEVNQQEQLAEQLREAVAQMNEYIQATQRDLRFTVDQDSGETIVRVLDRQTQEVIRQIPDEVFLNLARNLRVNEPVHFFSEQA